jgi:cobalt/nickel transport system permease protein
MTLAFDHLPHPDSLLSRLDPRWKLAAFALATFLVALLNTLSSAAIALAGALGLVALARLPRPWLVYRLGGLSLLLLLFVAVLPLILRDDGPSILVGPVQISWHGIRVAALLSLKALALATLVLVELTTSPLGATLKAANALHVPGLLVQVAMLSYCYIFVLGAELSRLRIALRVRGFRNRASKHSYRTIGHVAGTLLVRGHERAERVGQAMRCRGFDGRFRSLTEFRTTAADCLFFVLLVGGAGLLLLIEFIA